ncbi:MAG TPA: 2-oxoacid:acceptor oxidoreductase family protein [Syntrophorhabdales bacterium]|nr:2-oxoacid:acceptor oxidoreductase family protein [Syntrophorhabdales bacterium]
MRQQIVVSGIGGQGVLFVTRLFAEVAVEMGLEVLTSEIHGMAMRGGTVLAHVKVGTFKSPLIRRGEADVAIIVNAENVSLHRSFVKESGAILVNAGNAGDYVHVDADRLARNSGYPPGSNLVLVGYGVGKGLVFCEPEAAENVIRRMSGPVQVEANLASFALGRKQAMER